MLKVKNNNSPRLYESRAGYIIHRIQRLFQALRPLNESCNGSLETLKRFIMVNVRAYKAATYLPTTITICPFSLYIFKCKKKFNIQMGDNDRWILEIYGKEIKWLVVDGGGIFSAMIWFSPWRFLEVGHCKSIHCYSDWSPLSYDEAFIYFLSWSPCSLPGWQCLHP